ncbi:MAG TPA: hypothetical protein VF071_12570 [Candidatus Limnocylindria bacterium]
MTHQPRHEPTRGLYGQITHTDLASTDPDATRAWCERVLGWTFTSSVPSRAAFGEASVPIGFSGP